MKSHVHARKAIHIVIQNCKRLYSMNDLINMLTACIKILFLSHQYVTQCLYAFIYLVILQYR